jgi:hypothetical protein
MMREAFRPDTRQRLIAKVKYLSVAIPIWIGIGGVVAIGAVAFLRLLMVASEAIK